MNLAERKKKVIFIGVISILIIIGLVFFLLNKKEDAMLTKGSLSQTSQDVFESRYENIYDGIEAKNIKVKINEVEDGKVDYTLSMDTVAGKVSYDNKIAVQDGEIVFNEKMLFDGIEGENKVRVLTDEASRGKILDRNDK